MRMTNDEFQAEVFRRAAAYQRRQRTRFIWVRRTALAAGCLVIALTGLAVYPKLLKKNALMSPVSLDGTAQNNDAVQEAEAEYAADSAKSVEEHPAYESAEMEAVEEAESCAEDAVSAADPKDDDSNNPEYSGQDTTRSDSGPDPSKTYSRFIQKKEAEMLQYYGIASMPDTLAGYSRLTDRSDTLYRERTKLGITTDPDDSAFVQSDESVWIYQSEDSSRVIYVYLQTAQDGPSEEITCNALHDGRHLPDHSGCRETDRI